MIKKIFSLLMAIIIIALFAGCSTGKSKNEEEKNDVTGYYFKGNSGQIVFITDDGEPIILSNFCDNPDVINDLESFNRITVTIGAVLEEYPCSAAMYNCVKTADNAEHTLPEAVLNTLETLDAMGHVSLTDLGIK